MLGSCRRCPDRYTRRAQRTPLVMAAGASLLPCNGRSACGDYPLCPRYRPALEMRAPPYDPGNANGDGRAVPHEFIRVPPTFRGVLHDHSACPYGSEVLADHRREGDGIACAARNASASVSARPWTDPGAPPRNSSRCSARSSDFRVSRRPILRAVGVTGSVANRSLIHEAGWSWLPEPLVRQALEQGGHFSALQASQHGIGHGSLSYRVVRGQLLHVRRGVFRLATYQRTSLDHIYAAQIPVEGALDAGVVSHHSALEIFGLVPAGAGPVHVTVPRRHHSRRRKDGIVMHTSKTLAPEDVVDVQGIRATSVARSLVDTLQTRGVRQAPEIMRRAILQGLVSSKQFQAVARERPAWVAQSVDRITSEHPDGGADETESLTTRAGCLDCGGTAAGRQVRCVSCQTKVIRARIRDAGRRAQDRTMQRSSGRTGLPWTEEEDAILMNDTIPRIALAESLGRTYFAVGNRRRRLARDSDVTPMSSIGFKS
jgi:hypothetical protein